MCVCDEFKKERYDTSTVVVISITFYTSHLFFSVYDSSEKFIKGQLNFKSSLASMRSCSSHSIVLVRVLYLHVTCILFFLRVRPSSVQTLRANKQMMRHTALHGERDERERDQREEVLV